jgi:hypothetical protein
MVTYFLGKWVKVLLQPYYVELKFFNSTGGLRPLLIKKIVNQYQGSRILSICGTQCLRIPIRNFVDTLYSYPE